MKACIKCGLSKPLDRFHRHVRGKDGHLNVCKACKTRDMRVNYAGKRDHYLAYAAKYAQRPGVRERRRLAKQTATAKAKAKARNALAYAVRHGTLIRQPCEVCWAEPAQGHHSDYSRPFDVRWLCGKHHMQEHIHDKPEGLRP